MTKTIVSRAGHGGTSPGAVYKGIREADLTLQVDAAFEAALARKYSGYRLVRVRKEDVFVGLAENGIVAKRENADAYIEFHFNAGGGTGTETYVHNTNATDVDMRLAQIMQGKVIQCVRDFGVTRDRGIKVANFRSLRETAGIASCIMEILFLDNETDRAAYTAPRFMDAVGAALADGVAEFLQLSGADDDPELKAAVQHLLAVGILNSPEYWLQNAKKGGQVNGEFANVLLKRMAAALKQRDPDGTG